MRRLLDWCAALWKGRAPLWVAFWIVGILIGNLLGFTLEALWPADFDPSQSVGRAAVTAVIGIPTALAWFIFSTVSIWRCAPNASSKIWAVLARVALSLGLVSAVYIIWRAIDAPLE